MSEWFGIAAISIFAAASTCACDILHRIANAQQEIAAELKRIAGNKPALDEHEREVVRAVAKTILKQ